MEQLVFWTEFNFTVYIVSVQLNSIKPLDSKKETHWSSLAAFVCLNLKVCSAESSPKSFQSLLMYMTATIREANGTVFGSELILKC